MEQTYAQMNKYDEALASLQKGLEIATKIGVPTTSSRDLIGNLYLDKGELDKAEAFIKGANAWSSGRLHLLQSDYATAKKSYEWWLNLAEKMKSADALFTAYTGLGFACEGMGDDNKAEENFAKAISLTEDLRDSLPREQREAFFDVRVSGFLEQPLMMVSHES